MSRYLRFDSVGGASGDMLLSALVALGADAPTIEQQINAFLPQQIHIHCESASASGLHGVRVTVHAEHAEAHDAAVWPDAHHHQHAEGHGHHHHDVPAAHSHGHAHHGHTHDAHEHAHRGLNEIAALLDGAALTPATRTLALRVFRTLAEAEAKIHNKTPETVHFHEVGAWDSIADIVGCCIALEQLEVQGVACGPLPSGSGTIRCAHGEMPNPAPATQELLTGMLVVQTDEPFELVTPTGAALLRVWTQTLAPLPAVLTPLKSAFGFGSRTLTQRPNVVRATLSEALPCASALETLTVLETNLDDCSAEITADVTQTLLQQGARDVWQVPIMMKKGRAGILLSVLCDAEKAAALRQTLFEGTTTFGIRSYTVEREALAREIQKVQTAYGEVPIKIGRYRGRVVTRAPEYEACAALARQQNVSVRSVYAAALTAL